MDKGKIIIPRKGTPQGGIISPTLANMTMDGLEEAINKAVGVSYNKKGKKQGTDVKVNFIRYADDFVVTGVSPTILKEKAQSAIEQFLKERGLNLSKEKTSIVHINKGFDFLGQNVRKYGEVLLIKPSKSNIKAIKSKIKLIVNKNRSAKTCDLIRQFNPAIKG